MDRPTVITLLRLFRRGRQREDRVIAVDQSLWWREQWCWCEL